MSEKKDKMTNLKIQVDDKIKVEIDDRKDPTSFLPEEEMSYEIKKKKKKKKKKQEDPFKDIEEKLLKSRSPDITALDPDIGTLDPEVTIKVEDIEVDLDINDFDNDGLITETYEESLLEPIVKIEDQNRDAVLLTFENIISDKLLYGEKVIANHKTHYCQVCHLIFKTSKSLDVHQKRSHKRFRQSFQHICDHCGMSYEFKGSLIAHIRRKHGPNAEIDDPTEIACDICSLVFKGKSRLRLHMQRKHGSKDETFNHKCEYCGLAYSKMSSLIVHKRRKHLNKPKPKLNEWFNCPFCSKTFNKRETYVRHIQRNHRVKEEDESVKNAEEEFKKNFTNEKTGELTCDQCPLAFSSVGYLKWHMRRKHNNFMSDFRLKCKICNLSYARAESLKRHVRRKHDKGTYCFECNKQFDSREVFLNHTHSKEIKECNICGLIFGSKGGLAKHLRCTHKLDSPKTVYCTVCNAGFYSKRQLKPHFNRVHLKVSYNCQFCGKVFKTKESFRRHIMFKHPTNTNNDSKIHQCEKCTESFTDEFELCKHINTVHVDTDLVVIKKEDEDAKSLNIFKCTKCTEEYPVWELLRVHFEQTHYMTEELQCQVCGSLMSRAELVKHMKAHDEIEVKCRFCEFKSKNRSDMTQHMLRHKDAATIHCEYPNCRYKTFYEDAMLKHKRRHQEIGVKLQCASCPFQTMNKYILKYHEEAHATGKKRYQCDQCEYATILPANLVQHKFKHSTEKRFKCDVCPFATKYNTSLRFHVRKKHCDLPTVS